MSVTLKKNKLALREGDGPFESIDILADGDVNEQIEAIETYCETYLSAQETRAAGIVSDTQEAIDDIAETVASMAQLGTDTALTTSGMAADAKAVGDAVDELKSRITDNVDALKENVIIHITKNSVESGGYTPSSGKEATNKRLRLIDPFYVPRGSKIRVNIDTWYCYIFELSSVSTSGGNVITSTGAWAQVTEYTALHDCWIYAIFETAATYQESSVITVNDFGTKTLTVPTVTDILEELTLHFRPVIQQGSISTASGSEGTEAASTKSVRTVWIPRGELLNVSNDNSGYAFIAFLYDSSKTYLSRTSFFYSGTKTVENLVGSVENVAYIRIVVTGRNNETVTPEDFDDYSIEINCEKPKLEALQEEIDAVDAKIDAVSTDVTALETRIMADDLPAYWQTYMETKLPTVQSKVEDCALDGDSFAFITDYHYDPTRPNQTNVGYSHLLLRQIVDNSSLRKVVFGGDAINGSADKSVALSQMRTVSKRLHSIGGVLLGLRGNHEYNINDGGSVSVMLSDSEVYSWFTKSSEREITLSGLGLDYYLDNSEQKIRYIFMDSKYERTGQAVPIISDEQIAWMQEKMSELDSSWSIIVLTHELFGFNSNTGSAVTTTTYNASGQKIHNGVVAILSNLNATLVAVICGHCHYDYSTDEDGFWEISTTTDSKQEAGEWGKHTGDYREQAFDIYSIDKTNSKLYATRIGRGVDREWTY